MNGSFTPYASYDDFVYPTKMMTVSDVRKLYNIPKDYINAHRSSNSQAVANFLNISVNHNDTKLFQKVMAIRPQPAVRFCGVECFFFIRLFSTCTHTNEQVRFRGNQENDPFNLVDIEGSIDLQWIQGVGQGVNTSYYLHGGGSWGEEPFLDWLVSISNSDDPELVRGVLSDIPSLIFPL